MAGDARAAEVLQPLVDDRWRVTHRASIARALSLGAIRGSPPNALTGSIGPHQFTPIHAGRVRDAERKGASPRVMPRGMGVTESAG